MGKVRIVQIIHFPTISKEKMYHWGKNHVLINSKLNILATQKNYFSVVEKNKM